MKGYKLTRSPNPETYASGEVIFIKDENGIAHYYNHPSVGCYLVLESLMEAFNKVVLDICFLINYHMMPFNWDTDKAKQRWKERFGEYKYKMLLDFNECDKAR